MKVLSAALYAALLGQPALSATVQRPLFPALRRTALAALQEADDKPDASVSDSDVSSDVDASVAAPDAGASADAAVGSDADTSDTSSDSAFPALPAVEQMTR